MNIFELLLLAVGLSMDAFAAAVCKGLSMRRATLTKAAIVGLYFGFFQAIMPLAGYFLGAQFNEYIARFDHWIVCGLLSVIGLNMIRNAVSEKSPGVPEPEDLGFKSMILLAIATSIDAFSVGISFAFLPINIIFAVSVIGITTFALSAIGVKAGGTFGIKYRIKAEIFGGIILICIGVKTLIEHMWLT